MVSQQLVIQCDVLKNWIYRIFLKSAYWFPLYIMIFFIIYSKIYCHILFFLNFVSIFVAATKTSRDEADGTNELHVDNDREEIGIPSEFLLHDYIYAYRYSGG